MTWSQTRFRAECQALVESSGRPIDAAVEVALDRYVETVADLRKVRAAVRRGELEMRELVRFRDAAQRYGQALGIEPVAPAKQTGRPKGSVSAPDRRVASSPPKVLRVVS